MAAGRNSRMCPSASMTGWSNSARAAADGLCVTAGSPGPRLTAVDAVDVAGAPAAGRRHQVQDDHGLVDRLTQEPDRRDLAHAVLERLLGIGVLLAAGVPEVAEVGRRRTGGDGVHPDA